MWTSENRPKYNRDKLRSYAKSLRALAADEVETALGWLLEGLGNERKGIVYDTPEGREVGYETAMAPGRAALIRVLKASGLLSPAIQSALAEAGIPSDTDRGAIALALEPVGGSKMWITAEVKRQCRGRPRKNGSGGFKMKLTLVRREGGGRPGKGKDVEGVLEEWEAMKSADGCRNQKPLPDQLHISPATFHRRLKQGRAARAARESSRRL